MDGIRKKKISDGVNSLKKVKKKNPRSIEKSHDFSSSKKEVYAEKKIKKVSLRKTKHSNGFVGFLKKNKRIFKWIIFILVYVYILFVIFGELEKTTIVVKEETEKIEDTKKINIYAHPKYGQLGFSIISIKERRQENIIATKQIEAEEKANGFITIFNDYSNEPQKLSPETRFQSVSGKIFKLGKNEITIPGRKNNKAGSIRVKVYAEKAGPEYNIDVTDFSIPGFKESGLHEKYTNIYALSLNSFSGGFRGKKMTIDDSQKMQYVKKIENDLKELLLKRLEIEKTDRVILIDNSIQIFLKEPLVSDNNITEEAQLFAIVIEKKQLEKYLKHLYLPEIQAEEIRISDFNNIHFNFEKNEINFKNVDKLNVEMTVKNMFIWNLDLDLIKESILGLRKEDLPIILREFEEIQSAKINIFPFWKKNVSESLDNLTSSVASFEI